MFVFPPFRLDCAQEQLWKGQKLLPLRKKPFAILRYLIEHPKQLVTQEELLAQVWGGAKVSDSSIRSHFHELRQVLGEGVIETVIGRGYRFVANVIEEHGSSMPQQIALHDPLVVGRDAELATLHAAFARAASGRRQFCFVTGAPGIGKTTLVRTFLAGLGATVVGRGSCFEQHGTPEPYLAVIEAVTQLTRSARGSQALTTLVRYAPTFVMQVSHLATDEQLAEVKRRSLGGNESRQLRELCEALEVMSAIEPVVIVLEDLQWSDLATIDLLSLLGQRQESAKLLLIGTSRHAEIQRSDHPLNPVMRSLVTRSGALTVQVSSVGTEEVQHFIDRRFVGHRFPRALASLVANITGGTPLFMVSLLDDLLNRGLFAQVEEGWELTVSLEDVQAHRPSSVKQLIDIQVDRLAPTEQRVLEAASIVGAEFTSDLAAAALELAVEHVDDICDALARRGLFLRAEQDARYAFTHALVQEVCVERSSSIRRKRWHRLVAEAVARDVRADDLSHVLAHHFDAAADGARAVAAYAAAARHAARRYATSDTIALCARALELLEQLPSGRERDLLEFQLLSTMCQQVSSNSFKTAFAGREALAVHDRAIELARSLDDPASVYAAITQLCTYHMIVAQYDEALRVTPELERLERVHVLDAGLLQLGIFARAYIAFFRAEVEEAIQLFERLVPPETDASMLHDNQVGRAIAQGHLACAYWAMGDADRALDEALATIDVAERTKVPVVVALGYVVRARLRFLRRDALDVIDLEMSHALATSSVDVGLHTEVRALALWAKTQRHKLPLAEIQPLVDDFHRRLTEVCTNSTLVALPLIDALRSSDYVVEARQLTEEAVAFALSHNERVYLNELLRRRGELS